MNLKHLKLTNFKSYHTATYDFAEKLNLIFGLNGVGKTNLLDSIYCLAMTQSYFGVIDNLLINEGHKFYRLEGVLQRDIADQRVVIKSGKRIKKVVEKNNVPYEKLADHIGFMPVVMIAPDDIELINGGNTIRRSMLDRTISQVDADYLRHSITYARLLKQRNALLKHFLEGHTFDETMLCTYDERMNEPATFIYTRRKKFLQEYTPNLNAIYAQISDGKEQLYLDYESLIAEKKFIEVSQENRRKDCALGRTMTGPHMDKLTFTIDEKIMKSFASQGQKKSAIFASKLAQYDYLASASGQQPILLLDDIFDRLDHERVERLLNIILKDNFGQVFITDTEADRLADFFRSNSTELKRIEIT